MKAESRTYTENGVLVHEQMVPHMWVVISTYNPCPTTTPWDYYGMKNVREIQTVLRKVGIHPVSLTTTRTLLYPVGSGQGGAVRFGDNMTPGTYRVAVKKHQERRARSALAAHHEEVLNWLDGTAPMPEACQ